MLAQEWQQSLAEAPPSRRKGRRRRKAPCGFYYIALYSVLFCSILFCSILFYLFYSIFYSISIPYLSIHQDKISILRKKAIGIISFAPFNAHTTPLFKNCNILKFVDTINVECSIFDDYCFNMDYFSIFIKNFKFASVAQSYNTRSPRNGLLFVPSYNSVRFDRKSIIHSATFTCNHLQDKLTECKFLSLSPKSLKILLLRF